jgi:hypothetical protein
MPVIPATQEADRYQKDHGSKTASSKQKQFGRSHMENTKHSTELVDYLKWWNPAYSSTRSWIQAPVPQKNAWRYEQLWYVMLFSIFQRTSQKILQNWQRALCFFLLIFFFECLSKESTSRKFSVWFLELYCLYCSLVWIVKYTIHVYSFQPHTAAPQELPGNVKGKHSAIAECTLLPMRMTLNALLCNPMQYQ